MGAHTQELSRGQVRGAVVVPPDPMRSSDVIVTAEQTPPAFLRQNKHVSAFSFQKLAQHNKKKITPNGTLSRTRDIGS